MQWQQCQRKEMPSKIWDQKSQLTLMSIKEKTTKGLIYLLEKIIYYHLEYSLVTAGGDFTTGWHSAMWQPKGLI